MLTPSTLFRQNGEQKGPNVSKHWGQIGVWQTWHWSVVSSVLCLEQYLLVCACSCGVAAGGVSGAWPLLIRRRGASVAAGTAGGAGGAAGGGVAAGAEDAIRSEGAAG